MMFTAQDVVDHLLTATGGGAQDGEHRALRQAVVHGVREVFQSRQWLWHTKTGAFTTLRLATTATAITAGSQVITVADSTGIVIKSFDIIVDDIQGVGVTRSDVDLRTV